jgi:hypothetical protein
VQGRPTTTASEKEARTETWYEKLRRIAAEAEVHCGCARCSWQLRAPARIAHAAFNAHECGAPRFGPVPIAGPKADGCPHWLGNVSGYTNLGCRCEGCVRAYRQYQADYARRRRARLVSA